ncbi:porin PorA family protein [Streptacidiphilus sp. MAP12-16]|uniref:porin PorA family protein n=1 Tax=Streptacidiphilus sp. MAP12-16 TaxID=3156300 RepID=UPI003518C850
MARATAGVVGVVLIAGAFVLSFVITPVFVARLPSDTNAQRTYTGTFATLLDARAVAQGNLAAAFKQNVPMTVDRSVVVQSTAGNTALVSDTRTTSAAGTPVEKTSWAYALDRRTLEPKSSYPKSWAVVNAKGLTVSWPVGAKKTTYTGWVPETTTTTPVTYSHTETRSGLTTYVYQAGIPATRITDTQVLAGLPPAIPEQTLALAVQFSSAAPAQKTQLAALLPKLGNPVPLAYTLRGSDTFWVEPETGVVIDVKRSQQRMAGVVSPIDATFIPLLPVSDATYQQTSAAVSSAVHDANKGRDAISLFGTILPIVAGVVGALLVAAALLFGRRRASRPRSDSPA